MPTTLADLLLTRGHAEPEAALYTWSEGDDPPSASLSVGQLLDAARAVAAGLADLRGEPVLVVQPPGLGFVTALWGCLLAGVVAIPVIPPSDPRGVPRVRAIVADAGATVALGDPAIAAAARAMGIDHLRWRSVDALPPRGAPALPRPDDVALVQYTSGSTADPRGVVLTHANLLANLRAISHTFGLRTGDVGVSWLPPWHDMGLVGGLLAPLWTRGSMHLMSPLDFLARPMRWLERVSATGATISGGPDFAWSLCVRRSTEAERAALSLAGWRVAFSGAEPVQRATLARFTAAFAPAGFRPQAWLPCYGLAEATLLVAGGPLAAPDRLSPGPGVVSCGPAVPDHAVRVVDPARGAPVSDGEEGELWVRGPSVGQGIWRHPDDPAFAARTADGDGPWLRTGDLGRWTPDGLVVAGRLADRIDVRGRKLHPTDLERTAADRAGVRPGGVVAFGDGEGVVVVAETTGVPADPRALAAAIGRDVAAAHGVGVTAVHLVGRGELPRTPSGKLRRRAAAAAIATGELAALHRWLRPPRRDAGAVADALIGPPGDDEDVPLSELGLDSLGRAELTQALARRGLPVAAEALAGDPTLGEVRARIGGAASGPTRASDPGRGAGVPGGDTATVSDPGTARRSPEGHADDAPGGDTGTAWRSSEDHTTTTDAPGDDPATDDAGRLSPEARAPRAEPATDSAGRRSAEHAPVGGAPAPSPTLALSVLAFGSADAGPSLGEPDALARLARRAEAAGFAAIWLPERHFHPFGGHIPEPAVAAAALAVHTRTLRLRAGSVVLPLHPPLAVAERWAMVDRLSGGRVELAFAAGWDAASFALRPEAWATRREALDDAVAAVQAAWRGEAVPAVDGRGEPIALRALPRPVQRELPTWATVAGDPDAWVRAGRAGHDVLTALLFQSPEALAAGIGRYRAARAAAGHGPGRVCLMVHAAVGAPWKAVAPALRRYLAAAADLWAHEAEVLRALRGPARDAVLDAAVARAAGLGLFGDPATCAARAAAFAAAGVDELALLVDLGLPEEVALAGLDAAARAVGLPAPAGDDAPRAHAEQRAGPRTPPPPDPAAATGDPTRAQLVPDAATGAPGGDPARMRPGPDGATGAPGGDPARMRPGPDGATGAPGGDPARMRPGPDGATGTPGGDPARMRPAPDGATGAPSGDPARMRPAPDATSPASPAGGAGSPPARPARDAADDAAPAVRPAPPRPDPFAAPRAWDAPARARAAGAFPYLVPVEDPVGPASRVDGAPVWNLSSLDYLGLGADPRVRAAAAAAAARWGATVAGPRVYHGTTAEALALEARLAAFLGRPAAMTVGSGYQAVLAAVVGLLAPGDGPPGVLVVDALAHASFFDGAALAGCELRRFAHDDPDDLARVLDAVPGRPAVVAVEGVYSNEGDVASYAALRAVCAARGARLLVDDAHGLGVLGATGRGLEERAGLPGSADLVVGSLSKALGSTGGFVAGEAAVIDWLRLRSRPALFSASTLPPPAVAAADAALAILADEPARVDRLADRARTWRAALTARGLPILPGDGPLTPIPVGDEARCRALGVAARRRGVLVSAVIPPSVPPGGARLRTVATWGLDDAAVAAAADGLAAAWGDVAG